MSRGPSTFKQSDLTKVVKGLLNAGLSVERAEVDPTGKIVVFAGMPRNGEGGSESNEWDNVK